MSKSFFFFFLWLENPQLFVVKFYFHVITGKITLINHMWRIRLKIIVKELNLEHTVSCYRAGWTIYKVICLEMKVTSTSNEEIPIHIISEEIFPSKPKVKEWLHFDMKMAPQPKVEIQVQIKNHPSQIYVNIWLIAFNTHPQLFSTTNKSYKFHKDLTNNNIRLKYRVFFIR